MVTAEKMAQLRWQCRRGLLELDDLFGDFLEQVYPGLSAELQQQFMRLLQENDQQILAWLLAQNVSVESPFAQILQQLRDFRG